jgi:TatD DNase family protein
MIDIHCHLELLKDLDAVVKRAKRKGVIKIVTAGTDVKTNRFSLLVTSKYLEVECMLGIYPDEALKLIDEEIDEEIEFIRKKERDIVGVGEIGMDFKYTKEGEDRKRQEKVFRKFIRLAMELDKPVLVHSREAEKECVKILEEMKAKKVIMHCFSGSMDLAKRIEENGWFLSIPACVCYTEGFKEIVKEIDLKKLFCETDSPFLHPESRKRRDNEPGNVVFSYKEISKIKEIDLENVEEQIMENYEKLFS